MCDFCLFETGSHYVANWSRTHSINQAGLELTRDQPHEFWAKRQATVSLKPLLRYSSELTVYPERTFVSELAGLL